MVFLVTFLVFLLVVLLMALGVLSGRKQIQGSCGGIASLGLEKSCDCESVCGDHKTLYQIQEPNK
jgi:hypothetical protein